MKRYVKANIHPLRNEDFETWLTMARDPNIRPAVAENLWDMDFPTIKLQLMENPGIPSDLKERLRRLGSEQWTPYSVWSGEYVFLCEIDENHAEEEQVKTLMRSFFEKRGAICDDISMAYLDRDEVLINAKVRFARGYEEVVWYEICDALPDLGYPCVNDIEIY